MQLPNVCEMSYAWTEIVRILLSTKVVVNKVPNHLINGHRFQMSKTETECRIPQNVSMIMQTVI